MSNKGKSEVIDESDRRGGPVPKLRFAAFGNAGGWDVRLLKDICRPQQWTTISSSDLVEEGYPVYGANGFIGFYTDFNHEFETVAVTCRGSTCGEVTLIPPESYITGNSMCLDGIDKKKNSYHFIYQMLKYRGFKDIISGSAQPQIVGSAIKYLKIVIPKLVEQQKIADCLSSIDALIAAGAGRLDAMKDHKRGLMQQLFPVPGESTPRLRFPEFQDAAVWNEKKLEDVAHYSNDRVRTSSLDNSSYISTENILADYAGVKNSSALPSVERVSGFISGDILISNIRPYLKKIWAASFAGGASNDVLIVRSNGKSSQSYLQALLQNDDFVNYVMSGAKGVKMPRGDTASIMQYPVYVPCLDEQQRISAFLSSIDAFIAAETAKLEALKAHKRGLMQQLFPTADEVQG